MIVVQDLRTHSYKKEFSQLVACPDVITCHPGDRSSTLWLVRFATNRIHLIHYCAGDIPTGTSDVWHGSSEDRRVIRRIYIVVSVLLNIEQVRVEYTRKELNNITIPERPTRRREQLSKQWSVSLRR